MPFKVAEFPMYPPTELEAALNKFETANPGYTLIQAFDARAGSSLTGRVQVSTVNISGQKVQKVRTNLVAVFYRP